MVFVLPHLLVFLLLLLPISSIAQNNGTFEVGNSLTATENSTSWLSPSEKTIVWYANGDNPAPRGSKVELLADRGLVLTSPQGVELWKPNTFVGTVAYGVMNNTGNFELQDSNFNNIWESFKNPTDTLLPTQSMERGGVVSSRQSETNFSKGRLGDSCWKKKLPLSNGRVDSTLNELVEATNGFKEELGKGAFGVVYKGAIQMSSSSVPVAVKKLHNFFQDSEREFKTELNVIGQTHHKDLVRLLGFCDEGLQRLLVYEFMSNGTLASFLFGDLKPSWNQRIQIAFGIARGLLYLHEECSTQIIHCDIKPQNILLDNYYNARIADFGLAKLLKMDQSQTLTHIRGTRGYVAPEWFRNMPITAKVDVYSYGVMLLEIICCRRSVDMETCEEETAILTDWAYDCYREGSLDALVEYNLEAFADTEKLERFVMIAIWCIQEDPSLRPTMRRVTQMLEGVVEVLVPPCPNPFGKPGESSISSLHEGRIYSNHVLVFVFLSL
uniref:non-specific serine/threonine protein kinase n=1 Tax=Fagus sylvatica TaxID=28930 RepID=A0A2N9F8P0_FAGSY